MLNLILRRPPNCHQAGIQWRGVAGFTVIELLIAVLIAAILATLAAPLYTGLMARQRLKAVASELYADLSKTRSFAIARNANVTLSPKTGNWQNGWQILDAAANVLEDRNAAVGATITTAATGVSYRASGRVQGTSAPSFVISKAIGSNTYYQCVSVELNGRPYMKAASSC